VDFQKYRNRITTALILTCGSLCLAPALAKAALVENLQEKVGFNVRAEFLPFENLSGRSTTLAEAIFLERPTLVVFASFRAPQAQEKLAVFAKSLRAEFPKLSRDFEIAVVNTDFDSSRADGERLHSRILGALWDPAKITSWHFLMGSKSQVEGLACSLWTTDVYYDCIPRFSDIVFGFLSPGNPARSIISSFQYEPVVDPQGFEKRISDASVAGRESLGRRILVACQNLSPLRLLSPRRRHQSFWAWMTSAYRINERRLLTWWSGLHWSRDVVLRSSDGPLRISDLRGKRLIVYFGFLTCPDACPLAMQHLKAALETVPADVRAATVPVFVSVDWKRDTPENVGLYAKAFAANAVGLTGTKEQVDKAVAEFNTSYSFVTTPGSALGYTVKHGTEFHLVNSKGKVVGTLPLDASLVELRRAIEGLS